MARIHLKEWLNSNGKYKDVINDITSTAKEIKQLEYTGQCTYKAFNNSALEKLELIGVLYSYDSFRTVLKNQEKFRNNYIEMVETMLTLIRSSR